jgi:LDH2 family malate/lactate/ureidoglycolate dehydrogenase
MRYRRPVLTEFDAHGQSCLLVGPLAADWGYRTALREGVATVSLYNCRHQLFLLAYLLRVARRGVNLLATWNENDGLTQTIALISAENPHPTLYRYRFSPGDHIPNRETDWLHINYSRHEPLAFSAEMAQEFEVVSSAEFAAHFAHHRDHGLAVDADIWTELVEMGRGILVEATGESRRLGAGEQI